MLFLVCFPHFNFHQQDEQHRLKIAENIKLIHPSVDWKEASSYANYVYKWSKTYDINPDLVIGIIEVESGFKHTAVGKITHDFGPMQVNEYWLKKLNITRASLMTVDNGIKIGVSLLALKRQERIVDGCWWSIYNARNTEKRRKYEMRVNRVVARLGLWFDCTGVKPMDPANFISWEARNLPRSWQKVGRSATKTRLPRRLVVKNMGPDQVRGSVRTLAQFRD